MPNITDPKIWDRLTTETKVWWLKQQALINDIERCARCFEYACVCDGEIDV